MLRKAISLPLLFIAVTCAAQAAPARPTRAREITARPRDARDAPVILRPKEIGQACGGQSSGATSP